MVIADFRRDCDSRTKCLLSFMCLTHFYVQLSELEICCDLVRVASLDAFELPDSVVMLPQLHVFECERISRERIRRVFPQKPF